MKITKSNKVEDIYSKFESSLDGKLILFFEDIGNYLTSKGAVELIPGKKGKIIKYTNKYIPNQSEVDSIIQRIRAEVLEEDILTEDSLLLVYLLEKSKILDNYFSNYEQNQLVEKIDKIKNDSESIELSRASKVIDDLDNMVALFTILIMSYGA